MSPTIGFVLFPPVTFNRCHVSLSLSIYANSALSFARNEHQDTTNSRFCVFFMGTRPVYDPPGTMFSFFFFFFSFSFDATRSWKRFGSKIQECTVVTVIISVTTIPCSSPIARIIKSYRVLFASVERSGRQCSRSFCLSVFLDL